MSVNVCPYGKVHVYSGIVAGHVRCVNCHDQVTWTSAENSKHWVPLVVKEWD